MEGIIKIHNELKLVIPAELYSKELYSKERRQILLLLGSILDSYSKFKEISYKKQLDVLVSIEHSCYKKAVDKCSEEAIYVDWSNDKFKYMYSLICSRVSKNLDTNSEVMDSFLIENIINSSIDVTKLGGMSSDDMSDKNKELKEQLNSRRSQKVKQKTTSMYTCRNCKSRECTIRSQQMKSLDEGATLILNCVNCGFRFMIGS